MKRVYPHVNDAIVEAQVARATLAGSYFHRGAGLTPTASTPKGGTRAGTVVPRPAESAAAKADRARATWLAAERARAVELAITAEVERRRRATIVAAFSARTAVLALEFADLEARARFVERREQLLARNEARILAETLARVAQP